MIRKITLHNFMSHRHTVIEPASGLTVLVGENNCGKSAVVAALQILCNNTSGDYMVRHGQSECAVTVETNDGHVVEWKRRDGTVSYTLDGLAVHRLRGGIPEDLHKLLRLPQVHPQESDPFDVHFGEQKRPVFLLDEPGSRAAKFFASSSDAEALIRMQILHKQYVHDATQRSNQLQQQRSLIDRRLEPLKPVEDIQNRLDELDSCYSAMMTTREREETLDQDIKHLQEATNEDVRRRSEARVVEELKTPPRMRDISSVDLLIADLGHWWKSHQQCVSWKKSLGSLRAPPSLADTAALETLTQNIGYMSHEMCQVAEVTSAISSLATVPTLAQTNELEVICEEMGRCIVGTRHETEKTGCVEKLFPPPELFDVASLLKRAAEIANASDTSFRSQVKATTLGKCKPPPELRDDSSLGHLIDMVEQSALMVSDCMSVHGVLGTLSQPVLPVELSSLEAIIAGGATALEHVQTLQEEFRQAVASATGAEMELRNWVEEHRICPTCGAELDPDRLIAMSASGRRGHVHD